jgi:hypothetical protein
VLCDALPCHVEGLEQGALPGSGACRIARSSFKTLYDIGEGGARLRLERPLEAGTRVMLDVHFRTFGAGATVRFGGVVTRTREGSPGETAVRFHRTGRILRDRLGDFALSSGAA